MIQLTGQPANQSTKRAAFTLIELLVMVSIIALLIAILLPSLNTARETARRVTCASNMRQLNLAVQHYATDNFMALPPEVRNMHTVGGGKPSGHPSPDRFRGDMFDYLDLPEALWQCPSSMLPLEQDSTNVRGSMYGMIFGEPWNDARDQPNILTNYLYLANSYDVYNEAMYYVHDLDRMPRSLIKRADDGRSPSDQTLFADRVFYFAAGDVWRINHGDTSTEQVACDGGNQSFLDGHSQWVTAYPRPLVPGRHVDDGGPGNAELLHDSLGVWGHWWW